jgi:hypothetical protein
MTTTRVVVRTRKTKAVIAGVGSTLTALMTALATATVVLEDDAVDLSEITTITAAAVTLVATVYAVWRVPNTPVVTEKRTY